MKKIIDKLLEIHKEHPSYSYGKINAMAFADYKDIWGLSDKECLFALEKYQFELSLDGDSIASPEYMDRLYKDVNNFDHILDIDEEDE